MKPIEIDIDVYRCLETARVDFDETPNTILRRLLGIDKTEVVPQKKMLSVSLISKKMMSEEPQKVLELSDEISNYQSSVMQSRIQASMAESLRNWVYGGASLPEGTKLQKWLGRQKIEAVIHNGSIFVNGEYHQSPSSAAMAVNGGTNVNGWKFWEYFDEDTKQWYKISQLRKNNIHE